MQGPKSGWKKKQWARIAEVLAPNSSKLHFVCSALLSHIARAEYSLYLFPYLCDSFQNFVPTATEALIDCDLLSFSPSLSFLVDRWSLLITTRYVGDNWMLTINSDPYKEGQDWKVLREDRCPISLGSFPGNWTGHDRMLTTFGVYRRLIQKTQRYGKRHNESTIDLLLPDVYRYLYRNPSSPSLFFFSYYRYS